MANEMILDEGRAREYFDEMLDSMRRKVEDRVGEQFKELRRVSPHGVDEADLQVEIIKAVRLWADGEL